MARKAEVAKLDCKRIRDLVPPCHQNVGGFKSLWVKFLPWRYVSAENACFAIERSKTPFFLSLDVCVQIIHREFHKDTNLSVEQGKGVVVLDDMILLKNQ